MFFEHRGFHFFKLLGVNVSVSFWYGVLMAFIVMLWPTMGAMTYADGVIVALVVTFSLLVHEYGHALVAKRYRLGPSILLHAFGGICRTAQEANTDKKDARFVLAGPLAGLGLAGLTGLVYLFAPSFIVVSPVTETLFAALFWFNLVWSLVNLFLPIWPLDGGRLFHLLMRRFKPESTARKWTLSASIYTVVPIGIIGLLQFSNLLIVFFVAFVLMDNVRAMKSAVPLVERRDTKSKNKGSSFHQELLEEAEQALQQEDWSEAARLAHHLRSMGAMPARMLGEVWTILGIASMKMDEFEKALGYLNRAPKSLKVKRAIRRCKKEVEI